MSKIESYTEEKVIFGEVIGDPPRGVMWIAYEGDQPRAALYQCPCGCGNEIYTPLDNEGRFKHGPRWNYNPGPTLSPSIRWTSGCKAHFFIKDGKVEFCSDSGK